MRRPCFLHQYGVKLQRERGMYYVEKFKPSHDLERFKRSSFRITGTAVRTAAQIGYSKDDIHRVVSMMKKEQFYKSMTSYNDHTSWKDVYHVPDEDYMIYIKFTANHCISEFTLLSFKEK